MANHSSTTVVAYADTSVHEKVTIQFLASTGSLQAIIILITILTSSKLRKKITYIFVINLLFAQLLVSAITIPMYCFAPRHFLYPYVTALTIMAYILNLCTVTYERYVAICQPYQYAEKVSYSRALKTSVLCWVIALITQILPIFWKHHKYAAEIQRVYLAITLLAIFVIPLLMIWMVYAYITLEMVKLSQNSMSYIEPTTKQLSVPQNKVLNDDKKRCLAPQRKKSYFAVISNKLTRKHKPKKEFRLALVFLAAAVASNITWVPVILMVFLQVINRPDLEPEGMSKIHVYLLVINANVDSLIYGLFLRPLRKRLVRCFISDPYKLLNNRFGKPEIPKEDV